MENLPNEIVLEVFEYLFHSDIRYLQNISLANRRLHRLAKELLYSTYSLDYGDPALFIRALASSPGLLDCVSDVSWDCRKRNNYTLVTSDAFQFGGDFTYSERRYIKEKVGHDSSLGMTGLNQRFALLGEESYLSTFLMFTPKIQTINVAIPSKWNHHEFWFKSALNSPIFANLKTARIVGPMRIQNVLLLFLIPSLRTLDLKDVEADRNLVKQGVAFEWETNDEIVRRIQREGSDLDDFYVHGFHIDMSEMLQLLKSIRSLKTFKLLHVSGAEDAEHFQVALPGIMHHFNSLTSLSLLVGLTAADLGMLNPLEDLKHLRFLEYGFFERSERQVTSPEDLRIFLGHLPSQLEELVLNVLNPRGDENRPSAEFTDTLHSVAPMINTILPALKKLVVGGWDPILGLFTCQTQWKAMQLDFARAGVKLVSRPWTVPCKPGYDEHYNLDLYALDYVEEGWVWVQWIWDREWVHNRDGHPVDNWEIMCLVSDEEDWVMIQLSDYESNHMHQLVRGRMDPYNFSGGPQEWYREPEPQGPYCC